MASLDRILIFPIKSLDGLELTSAEIAGGGSLVGDREFVIVNPQGQWINGKRTAKVHSIRATYDWPQRRVTLAAPGLETTVFHLDDDRPALNQWLSDHFNEPVHLEHNLDTGFPDDPDSPGPTLISTATLQTISDWFQLPLADVRSRFRTNLELAAEQPFWEDQLYRSADQPYPFTIGDVQFQGINPCQRCIVPTRDSQSGTAIPGFQKTFIQKRQATLPPWANASRFNHFYRLAINTRIARSQAGKLLQIGQTCRPVGL
ncbi:MOSC N-terminal beta barrel domain-containing protein [Alkalinema sp. FACHB-956]|uniref:MOSC domain-containing protein n=1 Tax=Alkalinema sp. FACHB-956 TaxID=2692768 RepID=UPI0016884B6C|nr:MOSC N-terminal beta barrel domain-containing protein [Alkalinema sp. FACHB-956]MBD2329967.1 MOSC N-terminal beta barrel domain-containing protein [Alkalinema sp. FACHB-956]